MKLFSLIILFFSSTILAEIQVRDIGIIGLASHDLFSWDRKEEVNRENGRFDLSTIFDYEEGTRWKKGGDPKNGENSPVWSVTKRLVDNYAQRLKFYKAQKSESDFAHFKARQETIILFQTMIKDSYRRLSGVTLPEVGINSMVNNVEQASLRAFHDALPGRVNTMTRGLIREFDLTNFLFAKYYLNDTAMKQSVASFDGDYDEEYKNIKIPFTKVRVNLMEVDRKFIEKFSSYKQAEMLEELAAVGRGELDVVDLSFFENVKVMFQKGICSEGNSWMPKVECY